MAAICLFGAAVARGPAQDGPVALTSPSGATVEFGQGSTGWRLSRLITPQGPEGGWELAEEGVEVGTPDNGVFLQRGWRVVDLQPEKLILEQEAPGTGLRVRRVFSFGPAANVLRIESWVQSQEGSRVLARLGLLDLIVEGQAFRETGSAPASFPLFGQSLFVGLEHISGDCTVANRRRNRARLQHRPRLTVGEEWQFVAAAVIGWPQPGVGHGLPGSAGVREAFLHYLDTVRLKPDRIVLHTDTWWIVPPPLSEYSVLNNIETYRKAFFDRTGMFFDTYAVDLGWSANATLWNIDPDRFPNGLRPISERLGQLGSTLGLWLSPGSGYPEGLDNSWLREQGYEMMPYGAGLGQVPCFALGTRYQREFKERLVAHARENGLGHVILDFLPLRCDVASHGHPAGAESRYAIDAGLADVLTGLRAVNPGIALEPMVCGYPPSPWWLTKTPFVLGPAGDDLPYGRGPCPDWLESLVTARDVIYRASQESWIMPTQALETFDITVLSPGVFQNMAVMAIGRGRWFISTYITPELLQPADWDFLAALVRWTRQNKEHLVNAWQFGGRPENREAYGYMFRNATRDLYCVRNPWIEERTIELPASTTALDARDVRMIYPRRAAAGRIEPGGRGPTLRLAPYETVFLETAPAAEVEPEVPAPPGVEIGVRANSPQIASGPAPAQPPGSNGLRYSWDGTLSVPDNVEAELCVLVEGAPNVSQSTGRIRLGGRDVTARKVTSAGQFGAATAASPENWVWFLVPLARGDTAFQIELTTVLAQMSVGVYVRGVVPAGNDAAPDVPAVFPTFRANQRGWSQTLQALKEYPPKDGL